MHIVNDLPENQREHVVVDRNTCRMFIHHYNHMDASRYIPKEILDLEFTTKIGNRTSVGREMESLRERVGKLAGYMEVSLEKSDFMQGVTAVKVKQ